MRFVWLLLPVTARRCRFGNKEPFSFWASLTGTPVAPPLGELSPKVTERVIEDIQGKKTRNYAEFYFYLPELPDELLAVLP